MNDSLFIYLANPQVNIRLGQVTTNSGDLAADIDFRRGLIRGTGDSAASALELMSPDRPGQKMRFLGDIVDPDKAAGPDEMPPTFAEGDLVWFDQGTSPGTRGHRAVAFKCRVKDVFHVGFASYEFTILPLIGASSRPLRCTTEQLKYAGAGVSCLDEVSARGVSSFRKCVHEEGSK